MPRYAAIDIGSNSVRMEAAEVIPGNIPSILASDRQVTRLGESVFRAGTISKEAMELTCAVLKRMAEQYQRLDVIGVRAVATSAVRDARNQQEFLDRASRASGTAVEIVSGREEARLIHLGVLTRWPQPDQRVLMIDIGGGSAEIISSDSGQVRDAVSKPLGAVRLNEIFLQHDPPGTRELHQMDEYIGEKLAGLVRRIGDGHWHRAIATSATASAVACAIARVPRSQRDTADRLRGPTLQVRKLYKKLSERNLAERRKITGIGPRRAEIIIPGAAVLLRILEAFRLPSFYYSAAGVRDGIIADLAASGVGREQTRLNREQRREVEQMGRRYGVPPDHSRHVAALAHELFIATQPLHRLPPQQGKLLDAAAFLHDVGHYVNDAAHHKHSYYLVANSDIAGFTSRERELVANLCRYHRKAMPAPGHGNLQALNTEERQALTFLIPLLRLADNLDRGHNQNVRAVECSMRNGQFFLHLHAQGDIDLEQWAAERTAEVFRQVYGRTLLVTRANS